MSRCMINRDPLTTYGEIVLAGTADLPEGSGEVRLSP